jgi:hypothetical protein
MEKTRFIDIAERYKIFEILILSGCVFSLLWFKIDLTNTKDYAFPAIMIALAIQQIASILGKHK